MDTAARIAGPAAVGTSAATVYTSPAPALTVTVVRLIHVSNPTGGAINFTLSIGVDASGTRFYDAFPIAAGSTLDWSGFVVLEASEIVQAKASAVGLVLTVSGVVVDDGVADNIAGPTGPAGPAGSTGEVIGVALSDETTAITTGTAKATIRMPFAMTLTSVRASLTTASSSGVPTVDINEGGTSILSTKLTIDASEKTSTTAATAAVISDASLADDAEVTFDVDVAGTGATGLKVWLIGART